MKSFVKCLIGATILMALVIGGILSPKLSMSVYAAEITGNCGDSNNEGGESSVTWSLDDEGTLTISGTGKMVSYNTASAYPWYGYKDSIKSVVIEDGVTSTGAGFVYGYTSVETVVLLGWKNTTA